MSRERNHRYLDRVTDEASDWFVRLQDSEPGDDERADFAEWLAASPNNVREFLQVSALWGDLQDLGPDPEIEELIQTAINSNDENVVPFSDSSQAEEPATAVGATSGRGPRGWIWGVASAAAAIVVALTVSLIWYDATPDHYTTATGEQNSFVLSDGSVVTLNTRSEIRVRFTPTERRIVLVEGEALFDVASDSGRPFAVSVNGADIRAIGTQFNVRSRNQDTAVTVLEGIVEVIVTAASPEEAAPNTSPTGDESARPPDHVELTVGQMARVDLRSRQLEVTGADIEQATAWRERRLVFESRSLRDVVEEFNLYSDSPLTIDDPALETLEISGVFNADDCDSFVLFLEETELATASTGPNGRTSLHRSSSAAR